MTAYFQGLWVRYFITICPCLYNLLDILLAVIFIELYKMTLV